jgi:hypothetical protein
LQKKDLLGNKSNNFLEMTGIFKKCGKFLRKMGTICRVATVIAQN